MFFSIRSLLFGWLCALCTHEARFDAPKLCVISPRLVTKQRHWEGSIVTRIGALNSIEGWRKPNRMQSHNTLQSLSMLPHDPSFTDKMTVASQQVTLSQPDWATKLLDGELIQVLALLSRLPQAPPPLCYRSFGEEHVISWAPTILFKDSKDGR